MTIKTLAIAAFFLLCSCQVYNSASGDDITYAPGGTLEARARTILTTRCSQCHSYHQQTLATLSSSGLVAIGDSSSSTLILKLKGADLGGEEDMPPSGSLTLDEITALRDWIDSN